jgi:hypothetical protein
MRDSSVSYITATHKILYMFVALNNTTKQQETLVYTKLVSTYVISLVGCVIPDTWKCL